jgi:DNA-binding transcriptional regulator YiaG
MERWAPVKDFPEYEVSNLGRVRSKARYTNRLTNTGTVQRLPVHEKLLKPVAVRRKGWADRLEYMRVTLCSLDGRRRPVAVHILVLESFVGPRPSGLEGCHNDGNPANNRLYNLRWDTHKSNQEDMKDHGRTGVGPRRRGPEHHMARFSLDQIEEIRRLYATGEYSQDRLAEMFGCNQGSVSSWVRGKYRQAA